MRKGILRKRILEGQFRKGIAEGHFRKGIAEGHFRKGMKGTVHKLEFLQRIYPTHVISCQDIRITLASDPYNS